MHLLPRLGHHRKKTIADDREQPRPRVTSAKPVEAPIGAQYRLLNDVVSVSGRTRQPARKIVGRVEMRQGLRLKSAALVIHASERSLSSSVPGSCAYVTGAGAVLFPKLASDARMVRRWISYPP